MMSVLGKTCEVFDLYIHALEKEAEVQSYIAEILRFVESPIQKLPKNLILLAIDREGDSSKDDVCKSALTTLHLSE